MKAEVWGTMLLSGAPLRCRRYLIASGLQWNKLRRPGWVDGRLGQMEYGRVEGLNLGWIGWEQGVGGKSQFVVGHEGYVAMCGHVYALTGSPPIIAVSH